MKAKALINQLEIICQKHNIMANDVTVKFEEMDLDLMPYFDENTKTITYYRQQKK